MLHRKSITSRHVMFVTSPFPANLSPLLSSLEVCKPMCRCSLWLQGGFCHAFGKRTLPAGRERAEAQHLPSAFQVILIKVAQVNDLLNRYPFRVGADLLNGIARADFPFFQGTEVKARALASKE